MNLTTTPEHAAMNMEQGIPPTPGPQPRWQPEPAQPFDPRRKSPRLAAILSIVPGLGQVYVGYYTRGLVLAASWLMLLMVAANAPGRMEPAPGMAVFFLWLFNLIDAGRLAALYNHAMSGARSIELPEDFKMPAMGGSIVGGGVLAGFGALALSNTLFGFSLQWLEQWWPVLPLALGLYLVVRGVREGNAAPPRTMAGPRPGAPTEGTSSAEQS